MMGGADVLEVLITVRVPDRSGVPCRRQGRTSRRSGAALMLQVCAGGPLPHGANPARVFDRSGVPCRRQGRTSRRGGAALVLQVRAGPLPHGALGGRVLAGVHRRVARRRAEPARRPRLAPPLALLAGAPI